MDQRALVVAFDHEHFSQTHVDALYLEFGVKFKHVQQVFLGLIDLCVYEVDERQLVVGHNVFWVLGDQLLALPFVPVLEIRRDNLSGSHFPHAAATQATLAHDRVILHINAIVLFHRPPK